jgi:hypothetical protein
VTRATAWVVDVAIPRLITDHVLAPLRQRVRNADDRLERTARRLTHHQSNRIPPNPDRDVR